MAYQANSNNLSKLILALGLIFLPGFCTAGDTDNTEKELFRTRHQAGVRLGVWANQGELPPKSGDFTDAETGNVMGSFRTNINSASAYFEGYFGYRLSPYLMGELSLGTVNRGSVTLKDSTNASDIGNLIIYPILVQIKLYTPRFFGSSIHPFLMAGGGLYYGRRNVQFTNSQVYYANWQEENETDFNYVLGAGFDWPVAGTIAVDFMVKYMPINMPLVAIDKHDALAFIVGVKYLYSPK